MGKKKRDQQEEPPDETTRPRPDPLDTSHNPARWSMHDTSTPVELLRSLSLDGPPRVGSPVQDGVTAHVRSSLDREGKPALKQAFLEHMDKAIMRVGYKSWLEHRGLGKNWQQEIRLYLPLAIPEAMALLKLRYPDGHHALTRAAPVGDLTNAEVGQECYPPVGESSVRERKQRAVSFLQAVMAQPWVNH